MVRNEDARDSNSGSGTPASRQSLIIRPVPVPNCSIYLMRKNARADTRQHGAVEATDALRAIEKYSGLEYAELTSIRRQNPDEAKTQAERKWLEQYRLAVGEAQAGKLAQSFDRLDKQ